MTVSTMMAALRQGPRRLTACARALGAVLLLAAFVGPGMAGEITYKLTVAPPNGADYSYFGLINDRGHGVVWMPGEYEDPTYYAFWSPKTGYLGLYLPSKDEMYPFAMNNRDEVVGLKTATEVAIWTPNGILDTFLAPSGYVWIAPWGINDDGLVVGAVTDAAGVLHSFHRARGEDAVVDLPNQASCAVAVNNKGDVLVQHLADGSQYCDCPDALTVDLVRDHIAYPIRIPGHDEVCTSGLDGEGGAAVYSSSGGTTVSGLWTLQGGFTPIHHKDVGMVGVADRGIIAGNIYRQGAFLWSAQDGLRWVKEMTRKKDRDKGFDVRVVSPKGVLGGESGDLPGVLIPSR